MNYEYESPDRELYEYESGRSMNCHEHENSKPWILMNMNKKMPWTHEYESVVLILPIHISRKAHGIFQRCSIVYCEICGWSEMKLKKICTWFGFFVRESSPTIPSARRRFWKSLRQPAGPSGFSQSPPNIGDLGEYSLQKTRICYTNFCWMKKKIQEITL